MDKKLIIANWKMQKTFLQAQDWANKHKEELEVLAKNNEDTVLCICPSFESLSNLNNIFCNSKIFIGAQSCAPFLVGAYTGQVSPISLSQIGCSYCIIGHSEDRKYQNIKDREIGIRAKLLLDNNIIPIICVGETQQENTQKITQEVLEFQLSEILGNINNLQENKFQDVIIAYEPIWAIGSGVTPTMSEIENIINLVREFLKNYNKNINFKIIYGGSVNEFNINEFKNVKNIDGFLLGNSGLDFQVLKKIVSLY